MHDIAFNGFLFCLFFGRIIVNIIHNTSDYLPKVLRFLNAAFDSSGDCLIAGDHHLVNIQSICSPVSTQVKNIDISVMVPSN